MDVFDRIEARAIEIGKAAVNAELAGVKVEVDENTPIDTGDLISKTKIIPAELVGDQIIGSVVNDSDHAAVVEYGNSGKTFNYHKAKRIYYVGVGARMFTRAIDRLRGGITERLKKAFLIK